MTAPLQWLRWRSPWHGAAIHTRGHVSVSWRSRSFGGRGRAAAEWQAASCPGRPYPRSPGGRSPSPIAAYGSFCWRNYPGRVAGAGHLVRRNHDGNSAHLGAIFAKGREGRGCRLGLRRLLRCELVNLSCDGDAGGGTNSRGVCWATASPLFLVSLRAGPCHLSLCSLFPGSALR